METVLVVEDNRAMQRTLQRLFKADGLQVEIAGDGLAGLDSFRRQVPCAVVLDLTLPRLPGKELCRSFKSLAPGVPIVILSAKADTEDKVLLLELGADDYVTKPFSPKELLARVRRAMRRNLAAPQQLAGVPADATPRETLTLGDATIDFTSMEVWRDARLVAFTAQELRLLRFLAGSPNRVFTREELLNHVWGYDNYPTTRTVDNHILRLRRKLESDPARPRFFLTVHGIGYKFVNSSPADSPEKQGTKGPP